MNIQRRVQQGFTLIELMIVVAIIGILAAIAIPQYTQYTKKAKFTEVINATKALKTGVELCAQDNNNAVANCYTGQTTTLASPATSYGIQDIGATGKVSSVTVTANGVITATAVSTGGLNGETYILTPTVNGTNSITWAVTGTCRTAPAIC